MPENQMILQISDTPEKIRLLISLLSQVSIVEVARTGTLALQKCMED
jgi:acetolactate synthase-1/3 small subunit